jgi:hypothetical protein
LKRKVAQQRFREIYEDKIRMNGGLRIGGEGRRYQRRGGAAKGWRGECVRDKLDKNGDRRCGKYKYYYAPDQPTRKNRPKNPERVAAARDNLWINFILTHKPKDMLYFEALQDPELRREYQEYKKVFGLPQKEYKPRARQSRRPLYVY